MSSDTFDRDNPEVGVNAMRERAADPDDDEVDEYLDAEAEADERALRMALKGDL